MRNTILLFLLVSLLLINCRGFTENAKYELTSGNYKLKTAKRNNVPVYVYTTEDTLLALPIKKIDGKRQVDTSFSARSVFPERTVSQPPAHHIFKEFSFDLDVLAIVFKYRPEQAGMPRQLNAQLNGALYAGFRTDRYRISYERTPLGIAERTKTHYGYSIGLFSGFGTEYITPWVTQDRYPGEYDGLVWLYGIGGIVGVNNFTFGMGIGFDQLLDRNREIWIYQQKPWLGLTLGLNLN